MTAGAAEEVAPPSAELLLYLAEFADEEGKPEDPVAVDAQMPAEPATRKEEPSDEVRDRPQATPAKR